MKKARLTRKDIIGKAVILPLTVDVFAGDYEEIGYNAGIWGWNWSAYKKDGDATWYLQGYRNFPKNAKEM